MGQNSFELIPLIDRPEFFEQCIDLLNEEWPRSRNYRQISLRKVLNRSPPMAYVLIDPAGDLIGHARISTLGIEEKSCWVESVVIWKNKRGRGYGRTLMQRIEQKAREHGYFKIYLSTIDKREFYLRCSYSECAPILNCGSHFGLIERTGLNRMLSGCKDFKHGDYSVTPTNVSETSLEFTTNIPSAPPPPPSKISTSKNGKSYMSKFLE